MKAQYLAFGALALSFFAQLAFANELVVVSAGTEKKGGAVFSTDAMLDGQAVGIQFRVRIHGATEKTQVDLSGCLKGIPKTHSGGCGLSADKTVVTGLVYSSSNELLPKGHFPLGNVRVTSGEKVSFEVYEFLVAGDRGVPLASRIVTE